MIILAVVTLSSCDRSPQPGLREVPPWAARAIWYQIFPERFRNGDPANDPQYGDLAGSWPHDSVAGWQVSSWTGDWYALQPWERDGRGFYFHVQQRRYGGDLQGIIGKLDYLRDLGITALYLNPIFESPSLHKYDATFYHHVDNNFGPDPEGDRSVWASEDPADASTWRWSSADTLFLGLVREAHKRGMKVVLDGVFNHVGMTFWAFQDVRKNQARSQFKDWFTITSWDDPNTPGDEFSYVGWSGVRELPELREDSQGLVEGPREHVHAVVKRWMDPNGDGDPSDGIDGWRLDVADRVSLAFWRDFRGWVRGINPGAYLVGEVFWQDWKDGIMYNAAPWLQGDVFDAVMNYRWAREAFRFFAGKENKITAQEFCQRLSDLLGDYPDSRNPVMMNLYESHDTDRLPSHIVNGGLPYDRRVGVAENREYDVRKPEARETAIQRLMVLFQMTYIGAPTVYYGSEAGMWGADDPDCRKPMLWDDMRFAVERSHPFGSRRPVNPNLSDNDLLAWYKKLITLRRGHPSLSVGTVEFLQTRHEDVLAFRRHTSDESLFVVLNNADQARDVSLGLPVSEGHWIDLVSGEQFGGVQGTVVIPLGPHTGVVLGKAQER